MATPSSGTITVLDVDIYFNQSTTSWGQTNLTRNDATKSFHYIPIGESGINFIQLGLGFKSSNSILNMITPLYAEVEYEVTSKKK